MGKKILFHFRMSLAWSQLHWLMNLNIIDVLREQAYCCDGDNKEDDFIIWMTK